MSNSKDLVPTVWGPEFLERLLPSSQQVSLLFHLSYLCLGKFPKLERILRMRCVETQMLFGSSEAVLVKCMGTSNNLVTSLFPMLIIAIEKDKPTMAVKYLEKARMWITDIVRDVDVIVKRYEALNKDVATTTSDVNTEKKETEAAQKKLALENQPLKDAVNELKEKLNSKTAEIENIKREMEAINTRLQDEVREMSSRSIFDVLYIFFIRLPFLGDAIKWLLGAPETSDELRKLQNEMSRLYELKRTERQKEWELQVQLIDMRMILFKKECDEDN
ncbi:uncharacterized protein [Hoplias malabaricus]|uniref:uncharacterized protein n=1 Tax=Hoplias malabaricus TaxID=27720 RepID=UPI00346326B6